MVRGWTLLIICVCCAVQQPSAAQEEIVPTVTRVATGLQNPRGVAVLADGGLLVAQAGTGFIPDDPANYTGSLRVFEDTNADGDYDDDDERTPVVEHLPSYNILYQFNPGRDEVLGIGDVLALEDGRSFFTLDDNFEKLSIVALDAGLQPLGDFAVRDGSMNSLAYDPNREVIYIAESTLNTLSVMRLDGEVETITQFRLLAHSQQAVPSGVALDPLSGDVVVSLFSGQLWNYYDTILSYMPGDAKVVRVDPETGEVRDAITGLTTAVDVAVDEAGNIYVLEMTTAWATPLLTDAFDLYDPNAPPDAGGYPRFSGRVTRYTADGTTSQMLADGLDTPTNITYSDGALYVSTGQGTPGRPIWGRDGLTRIVGEILKITR